MKYWRIRFETSVGGTSEGIWLAEVTLKNAVGTDISVGGVASASSVYNSAYSATLAFDKKLTGGWSSAAGQFPCWIQYKLASSERVESIVLVAPNTSSELPVPGSTFVEFSENGVDWVTATSFTQSGSFSPNATVTLSGFVFPGISAYATAATPLGAAQALAYAQTTGKAAAPTPLGAAQVTAYAMVAGYAASLTPLGQPAALVFADTEVLGTVGRRTVFGMPVPVTINRVQDDILLAPSIPPLTALQGMPPGKMVTQASPLPPPVFGKPSVQFATNHPVASLEGMVVFGAPAVWSIHVAESLGPAQFSAMGAPVSTAHAASVQDGTQFGQPLASTLHALPDWYAGLLIGCAAAQSTGVFPVLDGVQLGGFGHPSLGATRHPAASVHMLPSFGQIAISFGDSTC